MALPSSSRQSVRQAREAFACALRHVDRGDIAADIGVDLDAAGLNMFTGGLSAEAVSAISTSGRVLFSTFSYAGTGVSIPKMTAMMFLTPRKAAMKQIIPRCLRRGSDLTIPRVVIDIVDVGTCLKKQFAVRKIALDHYGFKCVNVKVDWRELV